MCVYFILFIFLYNFYYTTKSLGLVGRSLSVVDYVLVVVVVGRVLMLLVFQEILVVGVGCIQSQTQSLSPLLPYEKHSNQLAWIERNFWWLGGLIFALLPYYPSFLWLCIVYGSMMETVCYFSSAWSGLGHLGRGVTALFFVSVCIPFHYLLSFLWFTVWVTAEIMRGVYIIFPGWYIKLIVA